MRWFEAVSDEVVGLEVRMVCEHREAEARAVVEECWVSVVFMKLDHKRLGDRVSLALDA